MSRCFHSVGVSHGNDMYNFAGVAFRVQAIDCDMMKLCVVDKCKQIESTAAGGGRGETGSEAVL